jgi:hypothetical protein
MNRQTLEKRKKGATKHSETSETFLYTGLCATCSIVDKCVSAKNGGYPVVECEEYEVDGRTFSETVEVTAPTPTKKAALVVKKTNEEAVIEGLCETCSHRKTCTFPRLEGGVWHCEEYA